MKKENITKLYNAHRMQIFPTVVALASLFLIAFVIYPQTTQLIANQKTIEDIGNKSKLLEAKITTLESFNEADLLRKVGLVMQSFPEEKDFGNILNLLQRLTAQSGFSISSVVFGDNSTKLENLDTYYAKLEISGPKIMLATLLNDLESSNRIIRINGLEYSANQAASAINVSLKIDALYSGLVKDTGGVDSPVAELSQQDEDLIAKIEKFNVTISGISNSITNPRGKSNPFE